MNEGVAKVSIGKLLGLIKEASGGSFKCHVMSLGRLLFYKPSIVRYSTCF